MIAAHRLAPFPLFARLSEPSLARLARHCDRRHYEVRQMLTTQGDPTSAFFLVEYGKVKVYRAAPDGREQVLHIVEPWQSFAEVAVLSMETYPASAEALEETAAIVVPESFLALVEDDPEAARAMLAGQALWLRRLIDQNTSLVLEEVITRLARYLVVYAEQHGIPVTDGSVIDLDVKRTVVAAQIGTVPETLARNIKKLCNLELIERDGKSFRVRDAGALQQMAFPQNRD